jgi:hypothetical protein
MHRKDLDLHDPGVITAWTLAYYERRAGEFPTGLPREQQPWLASVWRKSPI